MEEKIKELLDIIRHLRRACPWDRSQTLGSAKLFLPEEAYEVVSAIDAWEEKKVGAKDKIKEELGDLLIQTLFHLIICEEEGLFTAEEAIDEAKSKLTTRHPHVFGRAKRRNKEEVLFYWEKNKKKDKDRALFERMPALLLGSVYSEKLIRLKKGLVTNSQEDLLNNLTKEVERLPIILKKDSSSIKEALSKLILYIIILGRNKNIDLEVAFKEYLKDLG
jgi:tetrapyrrole methylase family protein/MazG family protein